jgi:hypothetical protein
VRVEAKENQVSTSTRKGTYSAEAKAKQRRVGVGEAKIGSLGTNRSHD